MKLFETIKLDPRVIKSIHQGLAIGIARVDRMGKSSVELVHKDILIKSYKTGHTLKIPIDNIDYLNYSKGNFLEEDKIRIGMFGNTLTIASDTDNESEVQNFYNNLFKIKNNEKMGATFIEDAEVFEEQNNKEENTSYTESTEDSHVSSPEKVEVKIIKDFNPSSEIRKYYDLMKDGIISQEEFDEKKKELLNYKYK